jgi:hypothetical protein
MQIGAERSQAKQRVWLIQSACRLVPLSVTVNREGLERPPFGFALSALRPGRTVPRVPLGAVAALR